MTTATITAIPTRSGACRGPTNRIGPSVRRPLIRRVRAEIAAGGYVTETKLDTAASRLLADIAGLGRGTCL